MFVVRRNIIVSPRSVFRRGFYYYLFIIVIIIIILSLSRARPPADARIPPRPVTTARRVPRKSISSKVDVIARTTYNTQYI